MASTRKPLTSLAPPRAHPTIGPGQAQPTKTQAPSPSHTAATSRDSFDSTGQPLSYERCQQLKMPSRTLRWALGQPEGAAVLGRLKKQLADIENSAGDGDGVLVQRD